MFGLSWLGPAMEGIRGSKSHSATSLGLHDGFDILVEHLDRSTAPLAKCRNATFGYLPWLSSARKASNFLPTRNESSLDLGKRPHGEAEQNWLRLPTERKFSDVTLDMPFGMCVFLEEDDVARAVAGRRHRIVFKDDRAFEDQHRLVEIVVPVEFAFGALPDHGRCEPVRAL
jgi:hypothetical protein